MAQSNRRLASLRLNKEYELLNHNPIENVCVKQMPNNPFEWHFTVSITLACAMEGGIYYGKILFPDEYPHSPPRVFMLTPNGKYKIDEPIYIGFHDDQDWNPTWNVASYLRGLERNLVEEPQFVHRSFLNADEDTKRRFALESLNYNRNNPTFLNMFPHFNAQE